MIRQPAVAGRFYPGQSASLNKAVRDFLTKEQERKAFGIMVPHAGYVYSGAIAGEIFSRVIIPSRVVILGPNHHGFGQSAAVYASGSWLTPMGETIIDEELAADILKECPGTAADTAAHRYEHSLEVQIPFLQAKAPAAAIVPICLGHLPLDVLMTMGEALGRVIARCPEEVLIVASTDMTHFESGEIARKKDRRAIDRVLALDPEGLYRTVRDGRISMCGMIPTVVMLAAVKQLGATSAVLVRYGNSGEVTGDQTEVVGYAGVIID